MNADSLRNTLGNPQWLRENEDKLKELLPDTWTHMENMKVLPLAFRFKLLGIDWRTEDDFARIMIFLERIGIMQRTNEYAVRANPDSIFR